MAQVEYITYKQKKYPVRLAYKVFKGMKADLGEIGFEKLGTLDPDVMETMLWHGLVSGHKYTEQPLELKKEQMEDVLDECMFEFFQLIPIFFPKAKTGNVLPGLGNLQAQEQQQEEDQNPQEKTSSSEITS